MKLVITTFCAEYLDQATETVAFEWHGETYERDLCPRHFGELIDGSRPDDEYWDDAFDRERQVARCPGRDGRPGGLTAPRSRLGAPARAAWLARELNESVVAIRDMARLTGPDPGAGLILSTRCSYCLEHSTEVVTFEVRGLALKLDLCPKHFTKFLDETRPPDEYWEDVWDPETRSVRPPMPRDQEA